MKLILNTMNYLLTTIKKLLKLIKLILLRNLIEIYQKGPYEIIPYSIQNQLKKL